MRAHNVHVYCDGSGLGNGRVVFGSVIRQFLWTLLCPSKNEFIVTIAFIVTVTLPLAFDWTHPKFIAVPPPPSTKTEVLSFLKYYCLQREFMGHIL